MTGTTGAGIAVGGTIAGTTGATGAAAMDDGIAGAGTGRMIGGSGGTTATVTGAKIEIASKGRGSRL